MEGYDEEQTTQLSTSYTTAFYLLTHHNPPPPHYSPPNLPSSPSPAALRHGPIPWLAPLSAEWLIQLHVVYREYTSDRIRRVHWKTFAPLSQNTGRRMRFNIFCCRPRFYTKTKCDKMISGICPAKVNTLRSLFFFFFTYQARELFKYPLRLK